MGQDRYKLRINGSEVNRYYFRSKIVKGWPTSKQELVVQHPQLGEFSVEDADGLSYGGFIVEINDSQITSMDRSWLPNGGWFVIPVDELHDLLTGKVDMKTKAT